MVAGYDIKKGYEVYGSDNEKIGTIDYCEEGFCRVDTGPFGMGKEIYVPSDSIADVTGNTVYLSMAASEIEHMGWDVPPSVHATREDRLSGRHGEHENRP